MEDLNKINSEKIVDDQSSNQSDLSEKISDENSLPENFGVQHDEEGNIIKVAENAVPPKAWKNQKKAYDDAWKNNKNQALEDDI